MGHQGERRVCEKHSCGTETHECDQQDDDADHLLANGWPTVCELRRHLSQCLVLSATDMHIWGTNVGVIPGPPLQQNDQHRSQKDFCNPAACLHACCCCCAVVVVVPSWSPLRCSHDCH